MDRQQVRKGTGRFPRQPNRLAGLAPNGGCLAWSPIASWVTFGVWLCAFLGFSPAAALGALAPTSPATDTNLFRVGFSSNTFADVNENDAMAAVRVWCTVLARERGVPVDPAPRVLKGLAAIEHALRNRAADAVALNTDEYWLLREILDPRIFIAGLNERSVAEEYVLLAPLEGPIRRIEDLRGRSIIFFHNSRMSLAHAWLDVLLVRAGLPRAAASNRVTQVNKLTKVILPVFFRQADACVVTRRGFNAIGELNPQVGQRLQVIASSPALVPSGFAFRRDYDDPLRETIISELGRMMSSPAGAQVLTLFQSGALEAHPISCLDSAFELLATHERLCGATNELAAVVANAPPESGAHGEKK